MISIKIPIKNNPVLSSDLPDIVVCTDHGFANIQILCEGQVLLEGKYYTDSQDITVYDIAPVIESALTTDRLNNFKTFTVQAEAEGVSAEPVNFEVLYCSRDTAIADAETWLKENFLTTSRTKRISPKGSLDLSWFSRKGETITVEVLATFRDGDDNLLTCKGILSDYSSVTGKNGTQFVSLYMDEIRNVVCESNITEIQDILSFSVKVGNRMSTFYVDPALEGNPIYYFTNCFNCIEQLHFAGDTTAKIKADRSLASLGKYSQFYDVTVSKEYETETGPLSLDECKLVEDFLSSNDVRISGYEDGTGIRSFDSMRQILITDFNSEITDGDDKLNLIKFTWRFARNLPAASLPDSPGIFNDTFNAIFN